MGGIGDIGEAEVIRIMAGITMETMTIMVETATTIIKPKRQPTR